MISISKLTIHVLTCLALAAASYKAIAATPTPLPPAAEEALNKGIIAAKVPDYLLAIRYFEEARKLASQAPVVYLNLGLAESRIPGRELRAMAWFGAYLAAYPDAPNATAVKEQIAVLEVRNQSNLSRLIKSVEDANNQINSGQTWRRFDVAELWAKAGDISAAFKIADLIQDDGFKKITQKRIVIAQAVTGDIAGALKTADLIPESSYAKALIAKSQAESGDIAGALRTPDLIQEGGWQSFAQRDIAATLAKSGDIAGALRIADLIQTANLKIHAQSLIAQAQAKSGVANAQRPTRQSTLDAQPPIQPAIKVSDWLKKLDDADKSNECPLNAGHFLDLAGYLKSLPSDDAQKIFNGMFDAAGKIVKAQNVISGMLKQQAAR